MSRSTSYLVLGAILAVGVVGGVGLGTSFGAPSAQQRPPEPPPAVASLQDAFNRIAE